jgi:hypothetical protein
MGASRPGVDCKAGSSDGQPGRTGQLPSEKTVTHSDIPVLVAALLAVHAAADDDDAGKEAVRRSWRWRRLAALSAASMPLCSCLQSSLQNAASPLHARMRNRMKHDRARGVLKPMCID